MSWKRRKTRKGRNTYYSLSKKLRQEKRSNDEFETMLGSLSLEEIIGLNQLVTDFMDFLCGLT